jgi:energy-coupling factor transporter ATP-binding protein EcfA2
LMFQYAKEYSAIAYPGELFPATAEGKRCLLCQQPLGDAAERLRRFQTFVTGTAATHATRLEASRDDALTAVHNLRLRQVADVQTLLAGLEELLSGGVALKKTVSAYFGALAARHRALSDAGSGRKPFEEVSDLPTDPSRDLMRAADQLRMLAEAREKAALDPAERERKLRERDNLKAKRSLSENLEAMLRRREDLVSLRRLLDCKKACDTTQISKKNTDLRRRHLTQAFERRIRSEIEGLGLAALPLRVTDRSVEASSYVGLLLDTAVKVQNHAILSEGEFRALALACFLAEVAGLPGCNGIVLDDPVASFDHLRTERVAKRLVREARAGRQVIVFTHDLVFYHELLNAAAEAEVSFAGHWVRAAEQTGPGAVHEGEEPWQAKKVGQRLDAIQRKLPRLEQIEQLSGEPYRAAIKDFYSDLRETWERLVEELLFDSTVCRYQREVKTQSLKGALVENGDYRKVFFGMKRASRLSGHDAAAGQQIELPTLEEIRSDFRELATYSHELSTRRNRLREERRSRTSASGGACLMNTSLWHERQGTSKSAPDPDTGFRRFGNQLSGKTEPTSA